MEKIRIGVIGIGSMGSQHLKFIENVSTLKLTAVCDIDTEKLDKVKEEYDVRAFKNYKDILNKEIVDAVLIATPHYSHTPITIDALNAGLHVITEKPIAAHIADAEKMIEAYNSHKNLKWAAMFMQRTMEIYKKLKDILDSGKYGKITRINYIITNWFRSQAYYDSGSWRATWKGEGGGVLLNQCPHQLDLFQWFFGMPEKIRAFCEIGKYHKIEVEDDVTAYMEFSDGKTAVFVTTTGDAPGTNRLEITLDKAKIIVESEKISITENNCAVSEFLKTSKEGFAQPETKQIDIEVKTDEGSLHQNIIENFADAILNGNPLIANGAEGINSVMLANSMLYSSLKNETVKLPLNSKKYEAVLMELIKNSTFEKNDEIKLDSSNFEKSFNK